MEGLKTTEIYFLVVLEARSLPSVLAGLFLLEAQSENPPLASLLVPGWLVAILGVPWLIDSSFHPYLRPTWPPPLCPLLFS